MQVGVGWWLMFEDRWAAVLRFLSQFSFFLHCSFLCCSLHCNVCVASFLCSSFVCLLVCLHCSVFVLQFLGAAILLRCNFFFAAVIFAFLCDADFAM